MSKVGAHSHETNDNKLPMSTIDEFSRMNYDRCVFSLFIYEPPRLPSYDIFPSNLFHL